MVIKRTREYDYANCRQCKHNGAKGCRVEELMEEKHKEMFIKRGMSGCYYFDSIREG